MRYTFESAILLVPFKSDDSNYEVVCDCSSFNSVGRLWPRRADRDRQPLGIALRLRCGPRAADQQWAGAMVFGGANAGANNGDLQASPRNAALMSGSQLHARMKHLELNESSLSNGSRSDRFNPHGERDILETLGTRRHVLVKARD
jgi:hypothetical protein